MLSSKKALDKNIQSLRTKIFSSSIQTVLSVLEFHQVNSLEFVDYNHRSGISPCPEDIQFMTSITIMTILVN